MMSDFEDFQSRVDQLKAETDDEIRRDRVAKSYEPTVAGVGRMMRDSFLRGFIESVGWLVGWIIFAGICVAGLALYMGISFPAALLMVVAIVGIVGVLAVFNR